MLPKSRGRPSGIVAHWLSNPAGAVAIETVESVGEAMPEASGGYTAWPANAGNCPLCMAGLVGAVVVPTLGEVDPMPASDNADVRLYCCLVSSLTTDPSQELLLSSIGGLVKWVDTF